MGNKVSGVQNPPNYYELELEQHVIKNKKNNKNQHTIMFSDYTTKFVDIPGFYFNDDKYFLTVDIDIEYTDMKFHCITQIFGTKNGKGKYDRSIVSMHLGGDNYIPIHFWISESGQLQYRNTTIYSNYNEYKHVKFQLK